MKQKPVFLFCFANDDQNQLQLNEEWRQIESALQADHDAEKISFNLSPGATLPDIWNKFNRFHQQIVIFHYGGHSGMDALDLIDAKLEGKSLATLIGEEPNLKLVFLNGCSNVGQVKALFEKAVPAVIATSAPINDGRAVLFSKQFYSALQSGRTIKAAFEVAAEFINNKERTTLVASRDVLKRHPEGETFPWGLYTKDETVLDWKIPAPEKKRYRFYLLLALSFFALATAYFYDQYKSMQHPLNLTVRVEDKTPNTALGKPKGMLTFSCGDDTKSKKQNEAEVLFKGIPPNFRGQEVRLAYKAAGYEDIDTNFLLDTKNVLVLPVRRDSSLAKIIGVIVDENNVPLEGVKVAVQDMAALTNAAGEFVLDIPFGKQRKKQRLTTFKIGYQKKDFETPVKENEMVRVVLYK